MAKKKKPKLYVVDGDSGPEISNEEMDRIALYQEEQAEQISKRMSFGEYRMTKGGVAIRQKERRACRRLV
jgi:hypothetical protein